MSDPLVSVCIPTFNGSRFLTETLQSIEHQTYRNIEVLVSDHSSTDSTLSIIERFPSLRPRVLSLRSSGSAADNWNNAVQNAEGEYIKVLCQDDLLKPTAIEVEVAALRMHASASFTFSPRDVISPRGRTLLRARGFKTSQLKLTINDSLRDVVRSGTNLFGEPCAVLIRKKAISRCQGFRGSYLIDLDMWLQLWSLGDAIHIDQSLSQFRISRNSWTSQLRGQQWRQMSEFLRLVACEHPELISEDDVRVGTRHARQLEIQRYVLSSMAELVRY